MLDNILNSSLLVLIAGVGVAVVIIAAQPEPGNESASAGNPVEGATTVMGRSRPTTVVDGTSQAAAQPPSAAFIGGTGH